MNLGALLVLIKLAQEIGITTIGAEDKEYGFKPKCSSGYYAYRDPATGDWSCQRTPTGR